MKMNKEEVKIAKRGKKMEQDMNDLVEYVKWITNDLG